MIADNKFDGPHRGKKKKEVSTSEILARQQPFDREAEMGVIGSVLLMPDICDEIASLKADDFYDEANQIIYRHLRDMFDSGEKIDITLLVSRMRTAGDFEKVGGAAYLAQLGGSVANAAHAAFYGEIVREKAMFRRLIESGTEILRDAYEQNSTAKELCAQAEQKVFAIMEGRSGNSVWAISDVLHQAMDRMEARMRDDYVEGGAETGLTDFDQMTGGLHHGELIILAARPSMGKTALAMNIAEHCAIVQREPVLFVSLEMSAIELADRMLCSLARVNGHRLRNGTISSDDRDRLVSKANDISQAPLFVDDSPSRTVSEIAAAARRIKRKEDGLGLIVIDYLQLIEPDNSRDPRQEQVAKIARRLKGMARELEVPLLCLSQLNRQAEDGKDHRPKLSHLRESGAIEQDADVVMFVHREEYYHRGEDKAQFAGQAEIIIAKQRNGPVGDVELTWEGDFTRFSNRAAEHHSEFDDYREFTSPGGF
ncbi:replicative DNA helicase [Rhodopirellula baltica]|uniref:Replicative DNA helicase n=3 Tax=Rhodopirellula baltica TaxID=265606 RepID=F2B1B0_RHOBT|nr:replicative DNA helicase [Rhodopirellula baltica]EGF24308.1 replicative DNA helicase [Rhodopirellula baltica WH47]EKK02112.1 replicative DNA helicase [Rhodopirellula baltica SH28]ELP34150.1 replicative DNA helicase [Rhodopirellula baltica SWK14]